MQDCLFCRIGEGQIPADIVYSDAEFVAFRDLNPQAPVHVLVIPRRHVSDIVALAETAAESAGQMLAVAGEVAGQLNLADGGYRVVFNTGDDGGQTVGHVHLHLLGGRRLTWPPG